MKRDIDYIEEKFRKDGLETPGSLSEEAMLEKLQAADSDPSAGATQEHAPAAPFSPRQKSFVRRHKGLAALAACMVLALVTAPLWKGGGENFWYGSDVLADEAGTSLVACASYDDLQEQIQKIREEESYMYGDRKSLTFSVEEDMAESTDSMADQDMAAAPEAAQKNGSAGSEAALAGGSMSDGSTAAGSHSDTYVQVEGIDEADIVKTDGKYIYHITGEGDIRISRPKGDSAEKVAAIRNGKREGWFQDLYLRDDRLIAIGNSYMEDRDVDDVAGGESISTVTVYDIEDPEHPEKLREFSQSGSVVSSRMAGGYVYLVTDCYVWGDDSFVPRVTPNGADTSEGGPEMKKLEVPDIYMLPHPQTPSYVVLSAIDIGGSKKIEARSKAVLGASDDIYCNGEHMYIAAAEATGKGGDYWYPGYRPEYTRILKASLKGGRVKFLNSASVKGSINNQFSMDEKDGYLRVATTSVRDQKDQNNLYVLDEDMKKAGSVTGLAEDEHIESVRFIGDRGYIITYKQTDPLFVLDLSDPRAPRVDGSVKISGFSTLLVPVDEKTLLGVGYCTRSTGAGEALDGTKLVLFDVSNPSRPKVKDSVEFPGMESPAQYEHKALLVGPNASWYAIPYGIWRSGAEEQNGPANEGALDEIPKVDDSDDVITYDAMTGDKIAEDSENDSDVETEADIETGDEEPWPENYEGGVLTFSVGKKIDDVEEHALTGSTVRRAIYIDREVYALDAEDEICGFRK